MWGGGGVAFYTSKTLLCGPYTYIDKKGVLLLQQEYPSTRSTGTMLLLHYVFDVFFLLHTKPILSSLVCHMCPKYDRGLTLVDV